MTENLQLFKDNNNNNNDKGKKAKGTKKCAIKRKLKCQDYNNCLKASQIKVK